MTNYWPWLLLFLMGAYHGINPGMGWLFAVSLGLQEKRWQAVLKALPPIAIGHALSITVVVAVAGLALANLPLFPLRVVVAALLCGFGIYRLFRSRHPSWVGMRVGFRDLVLWSFVMASAHGAGLMLLPILLGASHNGHPAPSTTNMGHQHQMHNMGPMHDMSHMDHAMPMNHVMPMQQGMQAGSMAEMNHPDPMQHMGAGGHMEHLSHLLTPSQMSTFNSPARCLAAVVVHTLGHLLVSGIVALIVYKKLGLAILRQAWFNLDLLWTIALIITGIFILFV
ncbi:MAG: hypothetical protein JOZ57_18730 [Abitibacteriaceae bacterium]|nr:hypothetical protein [Abditibacteriaceae bacterium]